MMPPHQPFDRAMYSLLWAGARVRRRCWSEANYIYLEGDRIRFASGTTYTPAQSDMVASDWERHVPKPSMHLEKVGNFQCALTTLKGGSGVRRESWPNTAAWVLASVEASSLCLRFNSDIGGGLYTPSPADLFAEDWYRVSFS